MKNHELNRLIALNLRKLRRNAKLTQEKLAEQLSVSSRLVQKWEAGSKGIGKEVLINLCDLFNVKPYVFYADDRDPIITNSRELRVIYKIRKAEKLGVADIIDEFGAFMVNRAEKKNSRASGKRSPRKKLNMYRKRKEPEREEKLEQ